MKELAYINKYFAKYKWKILAGVFFVICANALSTYTPLITRDAVNLITNSLEKARTSKEAAQLLDYAIAWQVFFLFAKYLLLSLLAGGFTFMMRQTIIVVSRLIEFDMKNEIYDHYQKLDLAFYRRNNTGDLMNRITEDVARVRMYIGPAIMYAVNLLFTITFAVSAMLWLDKELTLYVLIPLPLLSVIIYFVNERVEKISTHIQAKLSDLTTNAQETYSGIRVVQAYTREKEMLKYFEEESEAYKQEQLQLAKVDSIYFPVMSFLIGVSIIIVIFVGGIHVGAKKIDAGTLASFFDYVNKLMWPVSSLGWTASLIQRAAASQKRINEFMQQQPVINSEKGEEKKLRGEIVFNHVSFTYPDTGIEALKDVSFRIQPGERIAIIGKTGSGKTTIADLLMRMYDVSGGKILLDGSNINTLKPGFLRKQIGFVPQDVFLFSETITNNINFGTDNGNEIDAAKFARFASIGNEIESFPEKYETIVGERGVTLSGGQKQRISIARALIKQPEILLLDDSLSAVDATTEKQIQQNLNALMSKKTAIVITHRIFSLIQFDNILVLDKGKIVEQGKHEFLLKKGGLYADIFEKQMKEQEEVGN